MQKYKVHFVCRGNMNRSRLAEAFMRQINHPSIEVSSSGIDSDRFYGQLEHLPLDFVEPYARLAAEELGVRHYFARRRTQTIQELLDRAEIIVFMNDGIYRDAQKRYQINDAKVIVWHVRDIPNTRLTHGVRRRWKHQAIHTAEHIRVLCKDLARELTHLNWVDIVDEQNQPLGYRLPLPMANKKQLWHRGSHGVLTTPNGKYIIEKRSSSIVFAPNMLDITLGGAVDEGETPLAAIQREIREELGLAMPAHNLTQLEIIKWSSYHPRYKTHTKTFVYLYHGRVDNDTPAFKLQKKEVADVTILTGRQTHRLLRLHRLRSLGRLRDCYAHYSRSVKLTERLLAERHS